MVAGGSMQMFRRFRGSSPRLDDYGDGRTKKKNRTRCVLVRFRPLLVFVERLATAGLFAALYKRRASA